MNVKLNRNSPWLANALQKMTSLICLPHTAYQSVLKTQVVNKSQTTSEWQAFCFPPAAASTYSYADIYISIYLFAGISLAHLRASLFFKQCDFFFKLDLSTCWEHFYASYSPTSNLLIFLRRGCKWHRVGWHFLGSSLQINTWLIMQIRVTNISEIAPRKGGDLKLLWNTNTPLKPTVMKLSDED